MKDLSKGAVIFVSLALCLHLLFFASLHFGFLNPLYIEANEGHGQASDFFGIYQAGANLSGGFSIYDSDDYRNEAPRVVPFFYYYRYLPPTAYGFALISLILPPWSAYWFWVIVNEILLGLIIWSVVGWRIWPLRRRLIMAGLWLGFFPFYLEQNMGQFSLTMAAMLWFLWRFDIEGAQGKDLGPEPAFSWSALWADLRQYRWKQDRFGSPAVLASWTASLVLKSYTIFLVLPYLRDRMLKRAILGGILSAAVCAPYFIRRPNDLVEFARLNFNPTTHRILKGALGLQTFIMDGLTRLPGSWNNLLFTVGPLRVTPAKAILVLVSLAVVAWAARATLRLHNKPQRRAYDLAIWSAVFFLIFKTVWEYHYLMILPGLTAVYFVTGSRTVLTLGILMGLPTLYAACPLLTGVASAAPISEWPGWFRMLHFSVKSLPLLLFFIWCTRTEKRAGNRAELLNG
ncbi:MAG: hypothetical protein KJ970_01705 [Candidatus Eisenbacteria bacterium]|uniref:DUF2029 domain-containing protein n=1 Tax=Eiseniibacteriota bacterium TaxID=2212470 RepID=A0A948W4R5_UNCEI|nr:hypothetical protein [Candidatus Eisenbacteria bacterium]MBU1950167.1 hypothetical protein [Candidatus Eisenbacteria bacterium]MBU2689619.1 hypothetical protein [Candidatus Eisenbacteria bacterium]